MQSKWMLADWYSGRVVTRDEQRPVCTADPNGDAQLIAAAPDLLAALDGLQKEVQRLKYCVRDLPVDDRAVDAARAALARARGEGI